MIQKAVDKTLLLAFNLFLIYALFALILGIDNANVLVKGLINGFLALFH